MNHGWARSRMASATLGLPTGTELRTTWSAVQFPRAMRPSPIMSSQLRERARGVTGGTVRTRGPRNRPLDEADARQLRGRVGPLWGSWSICTGAFASSARETATKVATERSSPREPHLHQSPVPDSTQADWRHSQLDTRRRRPTEPRETRGVWQALTVPSDNSPAPLAPCARLDGLLAERAAESKGVWPKPQTAGHDLNVNVEPALHPNTRSQIRDAAESAATQVDVVRLPGRAPALA
jgi:hypothetical protein